MKHLFSITLLAVLVLITGCGNAPSPETASQTVQLQATQGTQLAAPVATQTTQITAPTATPTMTASTTTASSTK